MKTIRSKAPWPYVMGLIALGFGVSCARAAEPLWEIAVGAGALRTPQYTGSSRHRTFPFPIVYPIYRGERLRLDYEGVRGLITSSDRFELEMSFDGVPPVESGGTVREGMPDLDATVQFGPMAKIVLSSQPERRRLFLLNLPARAAFAVDFDNIQHVGYSAFPHVTMYQFFDWLGRNWRLGLSGGVLFQSAKYNRYYYNVDPTFATDNRPAYDSGGGYGGARLIATLLTRGERDWLSFFARYDYIGGAAFSDSPLVENRGALTVGVAYSYFVARSSTVVRDDTLIKVRDRNN